MTAPDLDYFTALRITHDETMARARARRSALRDAADSLAGLRGRARSAQGHVEAQAGASGALTALHLDASVTRLSPDAVGRLIVTTARAAAAEALAQHERVLRELVLDLDGER